LFGLHCTGTKQLKEIKMKKIILATAIVTLISGAAFAQSGANPSAPQPSSTGMGVNQPGTTGTGTAADRPDSKGGMTNNGMSNGTTGMNNNMQQGGESKDGMGGMSK
jgi:hypothetical protein